AHGTPISRCDRGRHDYARSGRRHGRFHRISDRGDRRRNDRGGRVFAPPFAIVVVAAPYYRRFAANPWVKALVQGVAAAVGAIAGAAVILARRALVDLVSVGLALVVLATLLKSEEDSRTCRHHCRRSCRTPIASIGLITSERKEIGMRIRNRNGLRVPSLVASLLIAAPLNYAQSADSPLPAKPQTIVFVCEHGSAKSVIAAAHFNRLASEKGLPYRAIARGINPDDKIPATVSNGLAADGLTVLGWQPTRVSP